MTNPDGVRSPDTAPAKEPTVPSVPWNDKCHASLDGSHTFGNDGCCIYCIPVSYLAPATPGSEIMARIVIRDGSVVTEPAEGAQPGEAERLAQKVEAVSEPPLTRAEARTLVAAFRSLRDQLRVEQSEIVPALQFAIEGLNRENAALQSQLEEARKESGRLRTQRDALGPELTALRERNTKLVEWARHRDKCANRWNAGKPCDCGLAALLAQEPTP